MLHKTFSCRRDDIFGFRIKLLYFRMKICCDNRLTSFLLIQNRFFLSLPVKKVSINKFSSQNIVISSQNNVPKYPTGQHEQVYRCPKLEKISIDFLKRILKRQNKKCMFRSPNRPLKFSRLQKLLQKRNIIM